MLESGCGDIIILPSKKKEKKKVKSQVNAAKNPMLSKSQKRKLKKLQEEKEKEQLLSKSIAMLEKYKIGEDVYSLMWSSRNLGQVETHREKRRREVEFSKAGLELPEFDQTFKKKKKKSDNAPQIVEFCEDKIQSPVHHSSVSADYSENMDCNNGAVSFDGDGDLSVEGVANEIICPAVQDIEVTRTIPCSQKEEIIKSKVIKDLDTKDNHKHESSLVSSSANTPIIPTAVHLSRPKDVEKQRMDLPIVMMEQEIMEALNENTSVIICGETGCGKTTQVPQFLYEAGFGSGSPNGRGGIIGVTQPRRVAVLATAKRVAFELGLQMGKEVGFQVRHDRRIGENCSIKFMTDGILLREVQSDFLLRRYSVIILDEAHERSLNTDILVGMLSRVIQERQREYEEQQKRILAGQTIEVCTRIYPLKLVLMSATLRVEDFLSGRRIFLNPPPVIEVPTRQYPVTVHFSKKTEIVDYVGQAFKKVMAIHKRLPPGGILVFVTGQREVEYLCRRLRKSSEEMILISATKGDNASFAIDDKTPDENAKNDINEAFELPGSSGHDITERFSSYTEDNADLSEDESVIFDDSGEETDLEYFSDIDNPDGKLVDGSIASLKADFEALARNNDPKSHSFRGPKAEDVPNQQSSATARNTHKDKSCTTGPMCVLPLYAMLPAASQLRVFENVREGERLVVVATNVAETSITIPGIKYVVDTGREKVKNYNTSNGIETYEIQWISKASAAQRAGRAGRTGPGHCYRLYSSAVFVNLFPDFSKAEILKVPIDGVVLLMKSMHIGKVANFPFPTPPEKKALIEAERCLKVLEALDDRGTLTPLGKAMSRFPMSPRHSRMLLTVIRIMQKEKGSDRANLVLGYAVAAAAALSLASPFIRHTKDGDSDVSGVVCGEKACSEGREEKSSKKKLRSDAKASREKFSDPKSDALTVACALQCFELSENQIEFCSENALHYKTMDEMSKLRKQLLQLVFGSTSGDLQQDMEFCWTHGVLDKVESAWKSASDKRHLRENEEPILRQAICAGWADRVAKRVSSTRYQAYKVEETVFLHRSSAVSTSPPDFVVYNELLHTNRSYIHGATSVEPSWLVQYARTLCTFSPIPDSRPFYHPTADQVLSQAAPTFDHHLWQLPSVGVPTEDDAARVVAFAFALLDGKVLPCLQGVKQYMAASPGIVFKPGSWGQKRVGNLLSKLNMKGRVIDSRAKLKALWKKNPGELYPEIKDWFQEEFHGRFGELWDDMLQQVKRRKQASTSPSEHTS